MIHIYDNSTAAQGFKIFSMKYRGKLSNAFQLDFMAKQIHINMPRRSRFLFSCPANGCSKGTGQGNKSQHLFPGHLRGKI